MDRHLCRELCVYGRVVGEGYVHYEDPFADPPESRRPARRLRGRLVSGVTLWTSGTAEARAGLTVSSVLVADGDPPLLLGLVADTTDLFEALVATASFVVHVLERSQRALAERFAGASPSPGGLFAELAFDDSPWGPVLAAAANRAFCRVVDVTEAGHQRLVRAEVSSVELGDLGAPLALFRGRYRSVDST